MKSYLPEHVSFAKIDPTPLEVLSPSQDSNNAQNHPLLAKRKLHLSFSSHIVLHLSSFALLLVAIGCESHFIFSDEEHLVYADAK